MARIKGQKNHEIVESRTMHINVRADIVHLCVSAKWLKGQGFQVRNKSELFGLVLKAVHDNVEVDTMSLTDATEWLIEEGFLNMANDRDKRVVLGNLAVGRRSEDDGVITLTKPKGAM